MIDNLHAILLDPEGQRPVTDPEALRHMGVDFGTWIGVFGSDEALRAYHNWCQCYVFRLGDRPPPWTLVYRLTVDLLLAARRDIGRSDTSATRRELLGLRLIDLYTNREVLDALDLPLEQVFERVAWEPPWRHETSKNVEAAPLPVAKKEAGRLD